MILLLVRLSRWFSSIQGDDSNLPKEQKEQKKGNPLLNLLGMTPTGMALKGAASLGSSFGKLEMVVLQWMQMVVFLVMSKDSWMKGIEYLNDESSYQDRVFFFPQNTMNLGKDPARDITGKVERISKGWC